jgi:hypothetical protein
MTFTWNTPRTMSATETSGSHEAQRDHPPKRWAHATLMHPSCTPDFVSASIFSLASDIFSRLQLIDSLIHYVGPDHHQNVCLCTLGTFGCGYTSSGPQYEREPPVCRGL